MQSAHKRRRLALGRAAVFAVAITLLGLSLAGARSAKNSPTNSSDVLSPDKGKLKILLAGQPIGTEEFEIAVTGTKWTARGTTELKVSQGASARVSGTLVLQPNGAPVSYEWTSQNEKKNGASIRFENGVAKMTLQLQGAQPLSPLCHSGAAVRLVEARRAELSRADSAGADPGHHQRRSQWHAGCWRKILRRIARQHLGPRSAPVRGQRPPLDASGSPLGKSQRGPGVTTLRPGWSAGNSKLFPSRKTARMTLSGVRAVKV